MAKQAKKSSLKPKIQKVKAKFFATYYSNPAKDLKVIAVTGKNGRATTAHFIQEIVKSRDPKVGLIIDPKSTSDLYKQLFKVWRSGTDHVIITAPSQAIANHLFYQLPFFAIVVTNTTTTAVQDEEIKSILFNKEPYFAILNHDDPNYALFSSFPAKSATLSYGRQNEADLRINRSKLYKMGTEANLAFQNEKFDVATYLTGEENVDYMAAAALTAMAIGLDSDAIVDGIANYEPAKTISPTTNDYSQF
jgi:UDP-N-acetylmuramoyl-L-alanyl-D-glutamate--2,6-diaminopimelate ligase